jgi:hypothetical protein
MRCTTRAFQPGRRRLEPPVPSGATSRSCAHGPGARLRTWQLMDPRARTQSRIGAGRQPVSRGRRVPFVGQPHEVFAREHLCVPGRHARGLHNCPARLLYEPPHVIATLRAGLHLHDVYSPFIGEEARIWGSVARTATKVHPLRSERSRGFPPRRGPCLSLLVPSYAMTEHQYETQGAVVGGASVPIGLAPVSGRPDPGGVGSLRRPRRNGPERERVCVAPRFLSTQGERALLFQYRHAATRSDPSFEWFARTGASGLSTAYR